MKKSNGITLIALVVTIIVLLILAGVSINMITSDNGIITRASDAAEKTKTNSKNEEQQLKDTSSYIDEKVNQVGEAQTQSTNKYGFYFEQKYIAIVDSDKYSLIFYEDTSAQLYVNSELAMDVPAGNIVYSSLKIDLSAIDFGIGVVSSNGKEININNIIFTLKESIIITKLPVYIRATESESELFVQVLNTLPTTPQEGDFYITEDYIYQYYIRKPSNADEFVGWSADIGVLEFVTMLTEYTDITITESLKSKLKSGQELSYGEILSQINNTPVISVSFNGNTKMTTTPQLPEHIIDLEDAFMDCTSLKTITNIPSQAISLHQTFSGCTSLESFNLPIPSSVLLMGNTFYNCTNLTGEIIVNANPKDTTYCFEKTVKPITITGSCTEETKANLAATSSNNNVTY